MGLDDGVATGGAWEDSSIIGMGANMSTELSDVVVVEESMSKPNKSTSGGADTGATGSTCLDTVLGGNCGVVVVEARVGAGGGGGGGGAPDIPPNKAAAILSFSNCSAVLIGATAGAEAGVLVTKPP